MGIRGLEPRTSSLSAKRSNRLSYIPEWLGSQQDPGREKEYQPLRVLESDEEAAGEAHAEVVEEPADGAESGSDDRVEHGDDEGE